MAAREGQATTAKMIDQRIVVHRMASMEAGIG